MTKKKKKFQNFRVFLRLSKIISWLVELVLETMKVVQTLKNKINVC